MIETHCHLDYLKQAPLEELVQLAKDQGVEKIITISVEPDNLPTVIDIASRFENVYTTQGIHPHDAKLATPESLKLIEENAQTVNKVLAIGEIGLDYYYNHSPRETQLSVFQQQLEIATKLKLPVVIHSRDADKDMMEVLKKYAPNMIKKGVIHSFSSTPKLAQVGLDLGFYLGFNGMITFKKAQDLRDIVKTIPLERILLETDSPFLTPTPHRGKENAPHYLPFIAQKIAEIHECEVEKVIEVTTKNANDLFFS